MRRCVINVYNGGSNTDAEDAYINMWVLTLVLRLRRMGITSLHPPPLACSGLSDNLSSPALFPQCNGTVTKAQTKLFIGRKRAHLMQKFIMSMTFLALAVTQTVKTEFFYRAVSLCHIYMFSNLHSKHH